MPPNLDQSTGVEGQDSVFSPKGMRQDVLTMDGSSTLGATLLHVLVLCAIVVELGLLVGKVAEAVPLRADLCIERDLARLLSILIHISFNEKNNTSSSLAISLPPVAIQPSSCLTSNFLRPNPTWV